MIITWRHSLRWGSAFTFGLVFLLAGHAQAQEVRGRVKDALSGEPISTAFILLFGEDGRRVTATLSGTSGSFQLGPAAPGSYRIGVERIGYETYMGPLFHLVAGQAESLELRVTATAIILDGVVAEGDRRCTVRPRDGLRANTLWEEARKALELTSWTEATVGLAFNTLLFERVRDFNSLRILGEYSRGRAVYGSLPFYSASAEELAIRGYVQELPDGSHQYFGLDAENLLSDAFLDTHCFRFHDPDPSSPLVGLAFEPLDRQRLPDIVGVLWLDRESAELRYLEYSYTRHLHLVKVPLGAFGGRMNFRRLESGAWIVSDWWIRMPQVQRAVFGDEFAPVARRHAFRIYEVGGVAEADGVAR